MLPLLPEEVTQPTKPPSEASISMPAPEHAPTFFDLIHPENEKAEVSHA